LVSIDMAWGGGGGGGGGGGSGGGKFLMFRLFIANAKGTFFGMSESLEASSRR
jgi:hypothetical protein